MQYNLKSMGVKIFYVTKSKLEELQKEYAELCAFEHKKGLGQEAPKLFESEDISAEFLSFQEDVGFLRSRIDELKEIIDHHEIIKNPPRDKQDMVGVGARVRIEVDGQRDELEIVGTLEANPAMGRISNESPVGRALIGHKIGDEIVVPSPARTTYKIKNIKYEVS